MTRSGKAPTLEADKYVLLLVSPTTRIYRHVFFIAFVIFAAYFRDIAFTPMASFLLKSVVVLLLLALFYANIYWLVPRYLLKRRFSAYALISLLFIGVIYSSIAGLMQLLAPYHFQQLTLQGYGEMSVLFFLFMMIVLIAASASVRLFQQWIWDNKMILELQDSKATAELEQLKNQINPHFLLNMLNNANVLTQRDPEKASLVLLGLSDLLRYQLYDSSRNYVLLTADIRFLEDLLRLEKIRRDNFEFIISKEGDINGILVSPLLFVTFVENAVKHSSEGENLTYIHIYFKAENEQLHFTCANSKPAVKAVYSSGGLGLANVRRRINLLYPSRHELIINDEADLYLVKLTIDL